MTSTYAGTLTGVGANAAVAANNKGDAWTPQMQRPRRNRKSAGVRAMVRETFLTPANLMQPIFIHEDSADVVAIASMPGQSRHTLDSMVSEVERGMALGVKSFILFPKVPDALKTNFADECYNPEGIVPRALIKLKAACPDAVVCTDIALDPYSDQGHDGIVLDGKIVNDMTIEQLCKQAVCHARAGADFVGPSDMMDGRVGALRLALDAEGFTDVGIISYCAKYASAFYGPFRDALDSHPGFGDKKTYQQDPANGREALVEAHLDAAEGADMLMVKPGVPYLDVIHRLRNEVDLPIAAYHVSGEYAMIKAAAEKGWIDEKDIVLETLLCFRRAGADVILTYFATDAAQWMADAGNVCL
jgi:porphobilinogen synthase